MICFEKDLKNENMKEYFPSKIFFDIREHLFQIVIINELTKSINYDEKILDDLFKGKGCGGVTELNTNLKNGIFENLFGGIFLKYFTLQNLDIKDL